ncbi:MAG TPA: S-adenosyl-l-methionine hydroxide adenosyltransferase family protein [Ohtaekwangia sp.]
MRFRLLIIFTLCIPFYSQGQKNALVLQSDFGLKDGAVSAMKGVAFGVSPSLNIFDVTHEIPAYNIWEAAYRLHQTAPYWPAGTVFVSVVDPGVGSSRKSVVLKTKTGHFFVTPDNGTLTLVAEYMGVAEVREIDEHVNRLKNSQESYTFHGRDVYAFTGARLAAGTITFEQVGKKLPNEVVMIPYQKPTVENGIVKGTIPVLDIQYGNVWTNVDKTTFQKLNIKNGDLLQVKIYQNNQQVVDLKMPFVQTFADVEEGKNLCYLNSLLNVSFGINQQNFSETYKVFSGAEWTVSIQKTN